MASRPTEPVPEDATRDRLAEVVRRLRERATGGGIPTPPAEATPPRHWTDRDTDDGEPSR